MVDFQRISSTLWQFWTPFLFSLVQFTSGCSWKHAKGFDVLRYVLQSFTNLWFVISSQSNNLQSTLVGVCYCHKHSGFLLSTKWSHAPVVDFERVYKLWRIWGDKDSFIGTKKSSQKSPQKFSSSRRNGPFFLMSVFFFLVLRNRATCCAEFQETARRGLHIWESEDAVTMQVM
jgi:hypothetical protein